MAEQTGTKTPAPPLSEEDIYKLILFHIEDDNTWRSLTSYARSRLHARRENDAEDLTQNTLGNVFEAASGLAAQWKQEASNITEEQARVRIRNFTMRAQHNAVIDLLKKAEYVKTQTVNDAFSESEHSDLQKLDSFEAILNSQGMCEPSGEEQVLGSHRDREAKATMLAILSLLPPPHQRILYFNLATTLSYDELGKTLDVGSPKVTLHRARDEVQQILKARAQAQISTAYDDIWPYLDSSVQAHLIGKAGNGPRTWENMLDHFEIVTERNCSESGCAASALPRIILDDETPQVPTAPLPNALQNKIAQRTQTKVLGR